MHKTSLNLLIQATIVHSKNQVVTSLSKIVEFTILVSNVSLSFTTILKCPHNKNDSIFTNNFLTNYSSRIIYNSHTPKDEHMHDFTQRFALIFKSTIVSSHSRYKNIFSRIVMGLRVKVWLFSLGACSTHEML